MTRASVLSILVGVSALAISLGAQQAPGGGRGPVFPPVSAPQKVAENLYMIPGSLAAGNTAEQAMADLKLPETLKDYNIAGGRGGPGGNFNVIFEELKAK